MPKPTDKLDAAPAANGPGDQTDWNAIDWRRQHRLVANLRKRIFRATRAGDYRKVRNLQKLMLRELRQHTGGRAACDPAECWKAVRLRGHTNRGVKVPTGQSTGCP